MGRHACAWGWAVAWGVTCSAPPAVLAQASAPAGIYSCQDSSGRRITADRPIADCRDREQRVLGSTGIEKARVGPSLTEQERLQAEQQRRQAQQARQQAQETLRREQALVQRYPQQAQHDAARAAALAVVDEQQDAADQRMDALRTERARHAKEMDFYRKDPSLAPAELRHRVQETEQSINQQLRYAQELQNERRRVQQRFDAELEVLQRLWLRSAPGD